MECTLKEKYEKITYSLDLHMSGTNMFVNKQALLIDQGNHPSFFNGLINMNLLSGDRPSRIKMLHLLMQTFKRVLGNIIDIF